MTVAGTPVDLSGLWAQLIPAIIFVLGSVATFAFYRGGTYLAAHTKLVTQQQVDMAEAAWSEMLMKAGVFGAGQAAAFVTNHGWDSVAVKSKGMATAAQFCADEFPDLLKKEGVDPTNKAQVEAAVTDGLNRVWPQAVTIVAKSPATPDESLSVATAGSIVNASAAAPAT